MKLNYRFILLSLLTSFTLAFVYSPRPVYAVIRLIGDNLKICTANCTVNSSAGYGNVIIEGKLGINKAPSANVDVTGAVSASTDTITAGSLVFSNTGHQIQEQNSNTIKIVSAMGTNSGLAMVNSAGSTMGYFYGDASGVGILTSGRGWGYRVDNSGNVFATNMSISTAGDYGLKVGNGSTGYLRLGASGWYDDGTYFSPAAYSTARQFYIQNSTSTSYLYSSTNYIGDSVSANNIYTRNAGITGDYWSINNAGNFSTPYNITINNAGTGPAQTLMYGSVVGNWAARLTFMKNVSSVNAYRMGYYSDGTFRVVYGTNGAETTYFQINPNTNATPTSGGSSIQFTSNLYLQGASSYGVYTRHSCCVDQWFRLTRWTDITAYHDLAVGAFYANGAQRFDLAEVTPVDPSENLVLGEIVTTDPSHSVRLHRSQSPYQTDTVGIVSNGNTASMVIGGETGPEALDNTKDKKPIALAGRVITIVNTENGPIKTGDVITTSSTAGVGMKAKEAGVVVSKAMEDFDGKTVNSEGVNFILKKLREKLSTPKMGDTEKNQIKDAISQIEKPLPKNTGRIITFVNVHSYDPDIKLVNLDDYELDSEKLTKDGSTINRLGAYAKLITGKLTTSLVETKKLVVDGVDLKAKYDSRQAKIEELKNKIEELKSKQ